MGLDMFMESNKSTQNVSVELGGYLWAAAGRWAATTTQRLRLGLANKPKIVEQSRWNVAGGITDS